jgi:hypothetical protein
MLIESAKTQCYPDQCSEPALGSRRKVAGTFGKVTSQSLDRRYLGSGEMVNE